MNVARLFFYVLLILIAVIRYIHMPQDDVYLNIYQDKMVDVIGTVIHEPEKKKHHTNIVLSIESISETSSSSNMSTSVSPAKSKLLVSIPLLQSVSYGDKVALRGVIKAPKKIISEDGSVFNYPAYLSKDFIFYVMKTENISVIASHQGSRIKEMLLDFKSALLEKFFSVFPTPHSFLAGGLIIAGKGSLDDELQEQFKRAGLIHIVVLSGFNITIVGQFIISLLSFLPAFLKNIFGSVGILLFSVMAGGSATVVRSVIMSLIGLYARASDVTYSALKGLFIAAVLMVVHNPKILFFDPSFQLSFVATLGLILLSSPIKKLCAWIPETFGVREIVSSTFATQIFVTPLILHLSGMISFVSLFVNILVLPVIPLTMLVVCISGLISFIHQSFSLPFAFVSYTLLSYELTIVRVASQYSFASIHFPRLPLSTMLVTYALYLLTFGAIFMYRMLRYRHKQTYDYSPKTKEPPV